TPAGTDTITASYGGDTNYLGSTSPTAITQVVNKASTTTAIVQSTLNPSIFGQSVTLTTTVTPVAPGAGIPTGMVPFDDGSTSLRNISLDAPGAATLTTSVLNAGSHSITATYNGDGNFLTSTTSSSLTQTVSQATTTTTLSSSVPNPTYGQTVVFTATISPQFPGSGPPTGTVIFSIDSGAGVTEPITSGTATLSISTLSVGSHTVTASYQGDNNFLTSSGTLSGGVSVTPAPLTITADDKSMTYGAAVPTLTVSYVGF